MQQDELREHVFSTYVNLRYGLAAIAVALPVVVYLVGIADGIPLQDSISAYYWASGAADAPARVWLVGGLFAISSGLYLYKGFTTAENIALNLAAILGIGVAVFPMEWQCGTECGKYSIHGFCAVSMFVCLAYVMGFRAHDTLRLLPAEENLARYRAIYAGLAVTMVASPVSAFVLNSLVGTSTTYVFFIEAAGIWAFAAYWWFKSGELQKSNATRRALRGEIAL